MWCVHEFLLGSEGNAESEGTMVAVYYPTLLANLQPCVPWWTVYTNIYSHPHTEQGYLPYPLSKPAILCPCTPTFIHT